MTALTVRERPSPNHGSRGEPPNIRPINLLVLHYTGMQSAAAALDRLCDPAARVSAHYLVEEDGAVWRLVPELRRAFHAGETFPPRNHAKLQRASRGTQRRKNGSWWNLVSVPSLGIASSA